MRKTGHTTDGQLTLSEKKKAEATAGTVHGEKKTNNASHKLSLPIEGVFPLKALQVFDILPVGLAHQWLAGYSYLFPARGLLGCLCCPRKGTNS